MKGWTEKISRMEKIHLQITKSLGQNLDSEKCGVAQINHYLYRSCGRAKPPVLLTSSQELIGA